MEETGEFNDWELLPVPCVGLHPGSNPDSGVSNGASESSEGDRSVQSDYFTLESERGKAIVVLEGDAEDRFINSNHPNWVDPCEDDEKILVGLVGIDLPRRDSGEFGLDSSIGTLVERQFGEEEEKAESGMEGNDSGAKNSAEFNLDSGGHGFVEEMAAGSKNRTIDGETDLGLGDFAQTNDDKPETEMASGLPSESEKRTVNGETELSLGDFAKPNDEVEVPSSVGTEAGNSSSVEVVHGNVTETEGEFSAEALGDASFGGGEQERSGEGEQRAVWWKLPLELLKFCMFRVSPVWTVSIAAAVVGFVMLGRRLRRMKRKTRRIPLKISVDDKNVSQFMNRANRLNEAFSIVKRVPIIRSSLPTARVVSPWPVVAIR